MQLNEAHKEDDVPSLFIIYRAYYVVVSVLFNVHNVHSASSKQSLEHFFGEFSIRSKVMKGSFSSAHGKMSQYFVSIPAITLLGDSCGMWIPSLAFDFINSYHMISHGFTCML